MFDGTVVVQLLMLYTGSCTFYSLLSFLRDYGNGVQISEKLRRFLKGTTPAARMERNTEDRQYLEIVVPAGSGPGSNITVLAPDGRHFEIIIPANVHAGDKINVIVPRVDETLPVPSAASTNEMDVSTDEEKRNSKKVAAYTAGVVLGSLIVGPVITGIVVGGAYLVTRPKVEEYKVPEGELVVDATFPEFDEEGNTIPPPEMTVFRAGLLATDKMHEIDRNYQISAGASKVIDKIKEKDEELRVSQTILGCVTGIDEKLKLSETTNKVVSSGVDKARTIDEEYKVSEKTSAIVSKGLNKAKEIDQNYQVSATVNKAADSTLKAAINFDEKYQVHQKVEEAAKSAAQKAAELDEQYGVTKTVLGWLSGYTNCHPPRADDAPVACGVGVVVPPMAGSGPSTAFNSSASLHYNTAAEGEVVVDFQSA